MHTLPSVRVRTILLFARHMQLTQGGTDIILKKCQLFVCCTDMKMTFGKKNKDVTSEGQRDKLLTDGMYLTVPPK